MTDFLYGLRLVARKGWTKRDADKLAGLTDEQITAALAVK